jgi:hypothetical protein
MSRVLISNTDYIHFTKIKYDGEKVLLRFTDDTENGTGGYEFEETETPSPDLPICLAALAIGVAQICEIDSIPLIADKIRVRGVSFNYKSGVRGTVITALLDLEKNPAPLCINTPNIPDEPYSEEGPCMPSDIANKLDNLVTAAKMYLKGERAQLSIAFREKKNLAG